MYDESRLSRTCNKQKLRGKVLSGLINDNRYQTVVEVGTYNAGLFYYLLTHTDASITGVDLYKVQPDNPLEKYTPGENGLTWDHEGYYTLVKELCAEFPKASFIRDWSTEAAAAFADNEIDMVFIDADHTYEGVKADIKAYRDKVRPGGIISGHDYNWEGVKKAVDEEFKEVELHPDNIWVVYK